VSPPRDGEWDEHLAAYPEATIYHTRLWARILAASFPRLRDESRWIERAGARAAFPLYAWSRAGGWLTTRQSSFPFLYGGPVPGTEGDPDFLQAALEETVRTGGSWRVLLSPFAEPGRGVPAGAPGFQAEAETTHVLRLPSTVEEFWDHVLTTAKRNDVRRVTKKGVQVRRGGSDEEVRGVYACYRQSFERWGSRPGFVYPIGFYSAMLRAGGDAVRLYLAESEGRLLGGAFVLRWNGHVHYHAGYFDHAARALRPNVVLQERIIREAIEDGFRDYDFLPSGGNRGVEEFKEGFGGVRTPVPCFVHLSAPHRILARIRRRSPNPPEARGASTP
jgi:hypothetical protein